GRAKRDRTPASRVGKGRVGDRQRGSPGRRCSGISADGGHGSNRVPQRPLKAKERTAFSARIRQAPHDLESSHLVDGRWSRRASMVQPRKKAAHIPLTQRQDLKKMQKRKLGKS